MKKTASPGGSSLRKAVLECLLRHRQRQDTLEGIAEWWLLEHRIAWTLVEVEKAVSELVGRGLVIERLGPDRRKYFQLDESKLANIQSLLDATE